MNSVEKSVKNIIRDVEKRGDQALLSLIYKFDKLKLKKNDLFVTENERKRASSHVPAELKKALLACSRRIQDFHMEEKKRIPTSWSFIKNGVRLGQNIQAVDSVGVYAPGGRFAYPSTVLMTAIPARIAGVKKIVLVTPPGRLSSEILYAAQLAGVDEVYRVGGPASIAALALGTATLPKVDLIVGPGNAYVTEAKRQLFGRVGIDLLAGPSELVVLADDSVPPDWIAADMAAQAEHDPDSRSVLISSKRDVINKVKEFISPKLKNQCSYFLTKNTIDSIAQANKVAGEHVQIFMRNPKSLVSKLKNGGAIFIGPWSTAVLGDYWAGPSHVLPTARSARFGSGLSVATFLKRSSLIEVSKKTFQKDWKEAYAVSRSEGLMNHAHSLSIRNQE
jgi:histidinol dehydrogenase